ncbi:MAG: hypothetical protein II917_10120, partial [Synergistaceae bacterium]|nr:hypothetical protein [Synergistaceae bacterium]
MKKLFVFALAVVLALAVSASAEEWTPKNNITMLVPWSAGGGADMAVRTLVPYLEEDLGVRITVVNATGANGWIAWNQLLKAKPDGYTIGQMNIPTVYSGYLDPQQRRKVNLESFSLLANEVSDSGCLIVKKGDPRFPNVKAFVEYAKNNQVIAGDNGVGTNKHLVAVSLNTRAIFNDISKGVKYIYES